MLVSERTLDATTMLFVEIKHPFRENLQERTLPKYGMTFPMPLSKLPTFGTAKERTIASLIQNSQTRLDISLR